MFKIVTDLHLSEAEFALVQEEGKKALQSKGGKTRISEIHVSEDPENPEELVLDIKYNNFVRRTRRISGYLADQDRFNAAKLAELKSRKAHL
jgi:hypothetical protein